MCFTKIYEIKSKSFFLCLSCVQPEKEFLYFVIYSVSLEAFFISSSIFILTFAYSWKDERQFFHENEKFVPKFMKTKKNKKRRIKSHLIASAWTAESWNRQMVCNSRDEKKTKTEHFLFQLFSFSSVVISNDSIVLNEWNSEWSQFPNRNNNEMKNEKKQINLLMNEFCRRDKKSKLFICRP